MSEAVRGRWPVASLWGAALLGIVLALELLDELNGLRARVTPRITTSDYE